MITILVPTRNEESDITNLLESLSSYPSIKEIIIIDGLSKDKTLDMVNKFKKKINKNKLKISIKKNSKILQGYALNIGIKAAKYPFIVRIDAHASIKKYDQKNDFFNEIKVLLEKEPICSLGFKQRFLFKNIIQSSIFFLSMTPFLSKSKYRYVTSRTLTKDTAWLFGIKKDLALKNGLFDPIATPNEDYEFNQRLIQNTSREILIFPELPIYYSPRSNLKGLAFQYFRYGSSRIRTMKSLGLLNQGLKKFIILTSLINTLLLSIFLFLSVLIFPPIYFITFIVIFSFYLNQYLKDNLIFSRYLEVKEQKIIFIIGIIIAPIISLLPFIFRNLGMISKLIKK